MMPKHFSKLLTIAAAMAAFAVAAPFAQATTPAPGYSQFAGCQDPATENSIISSCIHSVVKSGHFQMGNKDVPITNPITLSGGTDELLKNFSYNSKGGLVPAKQTVPGGIIGLTGLDWLINFLNVEQLKLYAVTELAGTPEFAGINKITLPIKVHLINPVLGNSCYVGTSKSPIALHLITGTTAPPPPNEPITGKAPEDNFDFETEILHLDNGTYVDNSFAAPGANGCVLNLGLIPVNIDGIINIASGLPSPAGTNETTQTIDTEIVSTENVYP
ncbi:MAG TPA: hypothetical protein VH275_09750 [Solirubrobacterales bacterium]|jgi:hypothetical protein|nr:hypothetical protein [Solirubrobacterales bacterium]